MSKRYDQYCPVCHALGLVGERWSLLVVRELLRGPKRYTDLVEGLPGIGFASSSKAESYVSASCLPRPRQRSTS